MPDWAVIFLLAVILLVIGMSFLRRRDRGVAEDASRREIIERLDRIERRLDER